MEFLHPALAAGAALAVIPIIIHLILREKPRREKFPALRLLRYRQRTVTRRLQVRHWLLLLLRVLAILLIALALARPRITTATAGLDTRAPAAVALVFDTSMSMQYRTGDNTALAVAQQAARSILEELPDESEVLVLDAANPEVALFMRPVEALDRVESLQLNPAATSVNRAILEGLEQLRSSTLDRKEMYIFTDLMNGAFDTAGAEAIRDAVSRVPGGVTLLIVDVGAERPVNAAIEECRPTSDSVPANSTVSLRTRVAYRGEGTFSGRLELYLDGQLRGQQPVELRADRPIEHRFVLRSLSSGFHQGEVRLLGPAVGLAFDDTWYFTLEVREPTRVAVVAHDEQDSLALAQALAPAELVRLGKERHRVDVIAPRRLRSIRAGEYDVLYLLDVAAPTADDWLAVGSFVRGGGGVGVFLGTRVQAANYATSEALAVLPAAPKAQVEPDEPVHLEAAVAAHPAVRLLHEWDPQALGRVVVYRYWLLQPQEDAEVVLRFTDGQPALLERSSASEGRRRGGTAVVMATPPIAAPILERWNDLPQSPATFVIFADQLTLHLAGVALRRWNWTIGEDVVLSVRSRRSARMYRLVGPEGTVPISGRVEGGQGVLVLNTPPVAGHYKVVLERNEQTAEYELSANVHRRESQLDRLSEGQVIAMFPEDGVTLARGTEELSSVAERARVGRELFPYLLGLLVLVFACEQWLANRFYSAV